MEYEEAMEALEQEGFLWHRLREYFPFGAIELREGNYQRLLTACLDRLSDELQRDRLLDLLDMQAATFLEQCWVQNDFEVMSAANKAAASGDYLGRFGMAAHFASAWLQINANLRRPRPGGGTNLMHALRSLSDGGSLAQCLKASTPGRGGDR